MAAALDRAGRQIGPVRAGQVRQPVLLPAWRRQRHLYAIHAQNWLEHYASGSPRHRLARLEFRTRLSAETAKWLLYALLRKRWPMLEDESESVTPHDQLWLRGLRRAVCELAALVGSERGRA